MEEIASVYPFSFADLRGFSLDRLRYFCITARARQAARDRNLTALLKGV